MNTIQTIQTPIIKFAGHHRKRAMSIELPDATAWLENLHLSMQTSVSGITVHYEIHATYVSPRCHDNEFAWSVSYPFDAYRRFRKQLLRTLQLGHSCSAECKWLHLVLKNHFPKVNLFSFNTPRLIEERQQSLLRILKMLQDSLKNRGNQKCNVLVNSVCYDFAAFIFGNNCNVPGIPLISAPSSQRSSNQSTRSSSASSRSYSKSSNDSDIVMSTICTGCECKNRRAVDRRCSVGLCPCVRVPA